MVLLPGKSHGWRSLVGCSPWGCKESDATERLHCHFSFSCIGEGNGNPLQCSCLENPRSGGAWWAAVYGVAQSQTWLKQLSSSSSSSSNEPESPALQADTLPSEPPGKSYAKMYKRVILFSFLFLKLKNDISTKVSRKTKKEVLSLVYLF